MLKLGIRGSVCPGNACLDGHGCLLFLPGGPETRPQKSTECRSLNRSVYIGCAASCSMVPNVSQSKSNSSGFHAKRWCHAHKYLAGTKRQEIMMAAATISQAESILKWHPCIDISSGGSCWSVYVSLCAPESVIRMCRRSIDGLWFIMLSAVLVLLVAPQMPRIRGPTDKSPPT